MMIYIARLEDNHYYVGKTNDLKKRYKDHQDGIGSVWTTMHPVIELVETFPQKEPDDEDRTVLKYMQRHGIDKVRGGMYSNVELSLEQMMFLRKQLYSMNDQCLACGSTDHFITKCNTEICYRCHRKGHDANHCYEKTHYNNGKLDGCYRCGRPDHWAIRCNRSKDVFGRPLEQKCSIQ